MKLYTGIIITIFISLAYKNQIDCKKVRNGEFFYYPKGTKEKVTIYRRDSLQIEVDGNGGGSITKSKIVWKDDCKFDLYLNAFNDVKPTGDDSIIAATPAHVEIIEMNDSFYVCLVNLAVFDRNIRLRDTIFFKQ